jgi:hypothetical protein
MLSSHYQKAVLLMPLGFIARIAEELGVSHGIVSRVSTGRKSSARIEQAIKSHIDATCEAWLKWKSNNPF